MRLDVPGYRRWGGLYGQFDPPQNCSKLLTCCCHVLPLFRLRTNVQKCCSPQPSPLESAFQTCSDHSGWQGIYCRKGGRQVVLSCRLVQAFLYKKGGIHETCQGGAWNHERVVNGITIADWFIPTQHPQAAAVFHIVRE